MELSDVGLLDSEAGRALLQSLAPYDERRALGLAEDLRRRGHSPALVAAALTQSRLRTQVAERWRLPVDGLPAQLLLTPDGAEQATRPAVAAWRARRFARLGPNSRVADLGCGIGLDTLAFADVGLAVDAFELDPVTAAAARVNAAQHQLADCITIERADVTALDAARWSSYEAVFADPARRKNGRRIKNPNQWRPSLSWVLGLQQPSLGVKVAPGIDRALVPRDAELAMTSVAGTLVEAAIYRGVLRNGRLTRSASLLPGCHVITDSQEPDTPPPVRRVGAYLHEPDDAVIRAALVGAVAAAIDGWLIDPRIAYISTDQPANSPFVRSYEVHDVMRFGLKPLRQYFRQRQIGEVVVKKRGSAVDVDRLRQQLRLEPNGKSRTLLLTRIGDEPVAIVAAPSQPLGSRAGVEADDLVPVVDEG